MNDDRVFGFGDGRAGHVDGNGGCGLDFPAFSIVEGDVYGLDGFYGIVNHAGCFIQDALIINGGYHHGGACRECFCRGDNGYVDAAGSCLESVLGNDRLFRFGCAAFFNGFFRFSGRSIFFGLGSCFAGSGLFFNLLRFGCGFYFVFQLVFNVHGGEAGISVVVVGKFLLAADEVFFLIKAFFAVRVGFDFGEGADQDAVRIVTVIVMSVGYGGSGLCDGAGQNFVLV